MKTKQKNTINIKNTQNAIPCAKSGVWHHLFLSSRWATAQPMNDHND
jgi:hypothetical protein